MEYFLIYQKSPFIFPILETCQTPTNVSSFVNSSEASFFDTLFPVPEDSKKFVKAEYRTEVINPMSIIMGQEGDQIRIALALQMNTLVTNKVLSRYNYLVGVGSKDFFTDQNIGLGLDDDTVGLAFPDLDPPFNRVAFVRNDQINTGTLIHELGHLFGQDKDFYKDEDIAEDDKSYCRAHYLKIENGGMELKECHEFNDYGHTTGIGYTGYDSLLYEYVDQPQSIMGGSSNINEQWIDRDTYSLLRKNSLIFIQESIVTSFKNSENSFL